MLDRITPLLLTLDELPNLERTLRPLDWARRIVVVDSGSRDGTLERLAQDARVSVFVRAFDSHPAQWSYALAETGIETEWVLCLDADHVLTEGLVRELESLRPDAGVGGFEAGFTYCIEGRPLRGSLYPPRLLLVRRAGARFASDGHTQRLETTGRVERLRCAALHDDRKPRGRWLAEQVRYAAIEAEKLVDTPKRDLSRPDRLRRLGWIAPWLVPLYCLTAKRGLLDGRAGWIYAGERAVAEWMLSMAICERLLRR